MLLKNILAFLLIGIIGTSLLNCDYFGEKSLAAYFGFCILSISFSIIFLAGSLWSVKQAFDKKNFPPLTPSNTFFLLVIYVCCHGIVTGQLNLSHWYWLCAGGLFFSISFSSQGITGSNGKLNGIAGLLNINAPLLYIGVAALAVLESIIVLLQYFRAVPSANELFSCTGTWANPNVTAVFLAFSLFAAGYTKRMKHGNKLFLAQLVFVLFAIPLLGSRSAYLVALIALLALFKPTIFSSRLIGIKLFIAGLLVALLAFGFKTGSSGGRIQIWKNCWSLIAEKPLWGVGFGQFEKEYNLLVATSGLPANDHVNMPYNDFLELFAEGGIIAVGLWVLFLVLMIRQLKSNSEGLAVLTAFILVQLFNFGFQAIPVFALFIIYAAILSGANKNVVHNSSITDNPYKLKIVLLSAILCNIYIGSRIFSIANGFHQLKLITEEPPGPGQAENYEALSQTMNFSSYYHEKYADYFMSAGNYPLANFHYRQSLLTTSNPNVLGKYGWSAGLLMQYDTAVHYFKLIEKLQPYKYAPRMALLKIYERKKDTAMIKSTALEIINMPVKVPGSEVDRIKEEAGKWLKDKF